MTILELIAKEVIKNGYRVFKNKDHSGWIYLITPSNNVLMISQEYFGGYNLAFKYKPSRECGTGCLAFDPYNTPTATEWIADPVAILKREEPGLEKWARRMKAPFYSSPDEWRKEQEEKWHWELEEVV